MFAIALASAAALSLQSALDRRVASVPGTGIAVAIIDRGTEKIYLAGSDGRGRSVDQGTLFEIGSVSKTFTATALAVIVEAGQVRLNDPIAKYLPRGVRAPAKSGRPMTLLDLAEQRSGLPRLPANLDDLGGDDPYRDYTLANMYAFLNGYRLSREPGSAYEYSNYGVGLLGQLLANRARTDYPDLLRRSVLDPLGMSDTTFALASVADPPTLAMGHNLGGVAIPAWHFRSILPAGGIVSNLRDMLKYLRCNMGQGRLARSCLFAQQARVSGEPGHRIGLIWNTNSATGVIAHGGDTLGFHAYVAVSGDRKTGVVALSNGPPVGDIAAHVMDPEYQIASCPSSVPDSKLDETSYAGIYCNSSGALTFTVEPTSNSDELSIALVPQPALTYRRVEPETYYAASVDATFTFVRQGGRIVGLQLIQSGQTIPAVRLNARGEPVVSQLPSRFPTQIALDPSLLEQYAGTYTADGFSFSVTLRGNGLYVQLSGQPAVAVFSSAKDEFFFKIVDARIHFNRGASGEVISLTLHQNGQEIVAKRIGR